MTGITIIGAGSMGRAIGTRAVAAGRRIQLLDRDPDKARSLAVQLGGDILTGAVGDALDGDIVVLAVPFESAKAVVRSYGDALAGRTIVDISNPVDFATFDSLVVPPGTSAAEIIADLAPDSASVVKAFNTTFAETLTEGKVAGQPLDVFIAGDDAEAKRAVANLVEEMGLRPIDVGPLRRAQELEGFQFLMMTLQADPAKQDFNWNTGLKILTPI
ncbi:reduced coenzyme F420:NADP oxidoreductase [Thermobifida fusca TM51]|uniref:Reduced coenzyme F420:NADP oxidoreductase n=1 Tax=Thermobifida fusca TM51 TaxID=1169414 RepID=A0A9P2T7B9_THEFU|nr:NADPH-dependent F420 reductase [Thermobifida fusca]EOR69972.1 reduced coenzyme F420:NADP oxidoreductase [Thermobifida fusca TM51]